MNLSQILDYFGKVFERVKLGINEFLPNFMGALLIILVGFLLARLVRTLARRFLKSIGRLIPGKSIRGRLNAEKMERAASFVANTLYWIIIFFFLTVATEALGLPIVTTWLSGIASYLPQALVAVLIGVAGFIGSVIVRDVIVSGAASVGMAYGSMMGKLVQYTILMLTILIALDQIGVEIRFFAAVIVTIIAALLFGAALAFGLGARTSISNILASYYLQKKYRVGFHGQN